MTDPVLDLRKLVQVVAQGERDAIKANQYIPRFVLYRDEHPRAFLFPKLEIDMDQNALAHAISVLVRSCARDAIVFATDSYKAKVPTKKNGEPWESGDMAKAIQEDNENRELVSEAFQMIVVDKDANAVIASLPYDRIDGEVSYDYDALTLHGDGYPMEDGVDGVVDGAIANMMRAAMQAPSLRDDMEAKFGISAEDDLSLTAQQIDIHGICAAAKVIMNKYGWEVAIACRSQEEADIVKRSFDNNMFDIARIE